MNLKKRLILILGGCALAAVMIHAIAAFIGISAHSKYICGSMADFHEITSKEKNKAEVTADSIYLETQFHFYFMVLEYFLAADDLSIAGQSFFKDSKANELDYLILERKGKIHYAENPGRDSKMKGITAGEEDTFLHQIRKGMNGKRRGIFAAHSVPGVLWVCVLNQKNDSVAVFRLSGKALLSKLPAKEGEFAVSLVWRGGFVASVSTPLTPEFVQHRIESICRHTEHSHSERLIATNMIRDEEGYAWTVSSAHLYTWSEIPAGLHVIHGSRSSARALRQVADIRDSFSGIHYLLLGGVLFSLLMILPVILMVSGRLAGQISEAVLFVREVFQSGGRPRNLELNFSRELEELSGTLNLLRDKLSSALSRLSRSHERELRAKQEAEESNILRSELLSSVLSEVRDPLARIDGYSKVLVQNSGNPELVAYSGEQVRQENRAMISVFRALSDLANLDASSHKLSSYQIEPAEIIRDALSDLQQRMTRSNLSVEIRSEAQLEEPLTTSPYLLTHTVYTAAATMIRFMPPNSRFRIGSKLQENSLVFYCADQVSDCISIAEIFREYTETGKIGAPHCAVAVLNLLILKTEAEYLGAEVRIARTEESNSMIEIKIPILGFNPAVTGVFTRPKIAKDSESAVSAARFHVAGIAGVSLAGRGSFGETGSVLLTDLAEKDSVLYRLILEGESFTVGSASNEEERRGYLQNNRFDLIIMNLPSDEKEGICQVSDLRKEIPQSTVLIVLTDSRKVEYVGKLLDSGADYCFRKPVVADDLLFAIRKLKSGRRDFL